MVGSRRPVRLRWEQADRHPTLTPLAAAGLLAAAILAVVGLPPVDLHGPLHRLGIMDPLCGMTRGVVGFLGVDYLDEEGAARRLAADTGVTYPLAADPKGTEVAKLGVTALPTTLFFSADGVLRGRRFGELNADRLRAAIQSYLGLQVP